MSELIVEIGAVVAAEDDLVLEDEVEDCVMEEEDDELWTRLYLTVEDRLKFSGQVVNGGQHASLTPDASSAIWVLGIIFTRSSSTGL